MSITDCQYRLGQCRAIGHAAQGYRRELQTRHPSFGPMLEHLQQLLIDRFVRAIGQQAPGLLRRKAEVHCPNLIHIAAATHARVGQGRIRPGADHQVQAWWRVLQQCRQELVHLSFGDLMVVVEDKNEVLRQIQELIAERGAERLRGMLMVLNRPQGRVADRTDHLHRRDQLRYETIKIVVVRIKRVPGRLDRCVGEPVREKGRLAKTGRSDDEDERAVQAQIQLPGKPWARNQTRGELRTHYFRAPSYIAATALGLRCIQIPGRGLREISSRNCHKNSFFGPRAVIRTI